MNYNKLYAAVKEEYSEDIALSVCIAYSIHLNLKIEDDDDMTDSGRYQKRIEENIRSVLWENDDIDLIIDLESRVYEWDISNSLSGLGGCTPKLFKEIKGVFSK
jgi:hypothetical protein